MDCEWKSIRFYGFSMDSNDQTGSDIAAKIQDTTPISMLGHKRRKRRNFRTYWWREIGWLGEALSPLENGD